MHQAGDSGDAVTHYGALLRRAKQRGYGDAAGVAAARPGHIVAAPAYGSCPWQ